MKFHPDSSGKQNYEETLTVKVNGGPDRLIRCFAKLPKVNVVPSHTLIDFGIIAVGVVGRSVVTLQNTSSHDAYFKCDVPVPELVINPDTGIVESSPKLTLMLGVIRGGGHQELELSLKPTKKFFYDTTISVNIPGMKPLKFNMKARADIPNISVKEEQFVFSGGTNRAHKADK